jgi:chromosomal replication initiation ATPase DnaA
MNTKAINPDAWAGLPMWARAAYRKTMPLTSFSSAHPVIQAVCRATGMGIDEIISDSRQADSVMARSVCVFIMRGKGYSYPELGAVFGKDHATMIHAYKCAYQRIGNPSYKKYTALYQQVNHLV